MPSWIVKILTNLAISKVGDFFEWIWDYVETKFRRKSIEKDNDTQADKVQSAADKIKELIKNGQPVPEELKDELRRESRKLVDDSFDDNRGK